MKVSRINIMKVFVRGENNHGIKVVNTLVYPNRLFSYNMEQPDVHGKFIQHLGDNIRGVSINGAIGFNILPESTDVEDECGCQSIGCVPFDTGNFTIVFKVYSKGKEIFDSVWTRSQALITCSRYNDEVENGTYFVIGIKQTMEIEKGYDIEDLSFSFELESAKNNKGHSIIDSRWPIYMDADIHYEVTDPL